MSRIVHVRLDDEDSAAFERLQRRTGAPVSDLVRAGLRLLLEQQPPEETPTIVGLGAFSSGVGDLASNKDHLRGLGRVRRPT